MPILLVKVPSPIQWMIFGGWLWKRKYKSLWWLVTSRRRENINAKDIGVRKMTRKRFNMGNILSDYWNLVKFAQTSWCARCASDGPAKMRTSPRRNEQFVSFITALGPITESRLKSSLCWKWFDSSVTVKLQKLCPFWFIVRRVAEGLVPSVPLISYGDSWELGNWPVIFPSTIWSVICEDRELPWFKPSTNTF